MSSLCNIVHGLRVFYVKLFWGGSSNSRIMTTRTYSFCLLKLIEHELEISGMKEKMGNNDIKEDIIKQINKFQQDVGQLLQTIILIDDNDVKSTRRFYSVMRHTFICICTVKSGEWSFWNGLDFLILLIIMYSSRPSYRISGLQSPLLGDE